MKGNKTFEILELIKDATYDTQALLEVFLTSGCGTSFNQMEKNGAKK